MPLKPPRPFHTLLPFQRRIVLAMIRAFLQEAERYQHIFSRYGLEASEESIINLLDTGELRFFAETENGETTFTLRLFHPRLKKYVAL